MDYAAKDVLATLVAESGFSYREIENKLQGEITYSRVRDICVARRTPVRLSEFILISSVCHSTPLIALQEVFRREQEIQQMEYDATPDNDKTGLNEDLIDLGSSIVTDDEIADTIKNSMSLAAYTGDHKLDDEGDEPA